MREAGNPGIQCRRTERTHVHRSGLGGQREDFVAFELEKFGGAHGSAIRERVTCNPVPAPGLVLWRGRPPYASSKHIFRISCSNFARFKEVFIRHLKTGQFISVWVNGNWRIPFRFVGADIELVDYRDYH